MSELPTGADAVRGLHLDVLDKGFVRVVDVMGNDAAIVQAARVSYADGTKSVREDRGLIRYLMKHWHTSPFEMCEIKLHVKAPIFVARQWLRHRTASVNEQSARYSIVKEEFYQPSPENVAFQSKVNNQGRGAALDSARAEQVVSALMSDAQNSYSLYENLIDEKDEEGVARELARIALPLSTYTEFYWKIDLHNLLHFLRLRADAHAQLEIRAFADAMLAVVERWVPSTYEAFVDYRMEAKQLSRMELFAIRRLLRGEAVDASMAGMSGREWKEFEALFQIANVELSKTGDQDLRADLIAAE